MTNKTLYDLLKTTGLPVAHIEFEKPPSIPFIVYMIDDETHRGADGKNNIIERGCRVELYTNKTDISTEQTIDNLLNFTEFDKNKSYIKEEKLYQIAYDFFLILK